MQYSEYYFRSTFFAEKKVEEEKERLINASFTAWQIVRQSGEKRSWYDYLSSFGLYDKPKVKTSIEEAIETSNNIDRLLKK